MKNVVYIELVQIVVIVNEKPLFHHNSDLNDSRKLIVYQKVLIVHHAFSN